MKKLLIIIALLAGILCGYKYITAAKEPTSLYEYTWDLRAELTDLEDVECKTEEEKGRIKDLKEKIQRIQESSAYKISKKQYYGEI